MSNSNDSGFVSSDGYVMGPPSGRMSGFGYGLGISVGILLLITTITLMSYFCTRTTGPTAPGSRQRSGGGEAEHDVEAGLDEATLMSYPKVVYAQAKIEKKGTAATCCSICLADYRDDEVLRLLPECGHLFHLSCVDPWLRSRPTCPMCRSSPVPSPMATPLAEVVPLAQAQRS